MTKCVYCGLLLGHDPLPEMCPNCGADGYTDRDANRAKRYIPPWRRPLPDDYEPTWDPRERD